MSDETDYRKRIPPAEKRFPPRTDKSASPPGQDFDTMTKLHGRPRGYFEREQPPKREPQAES